MKRNLGDRITILEFRRRSTQIVPRSKGESWLEYISRVGIEAAKRRPPPFNPGWTWDWDRLDWIEHPTRPRTRLAPVFT